jgi:hypothetical protein
MQFVPRQENREASAELKEVLTISQSSAELLANVFEGGFSANCPPILNLPKGMSRG